MYKFELWHEGNCLTESDFEFADEEEALEEGTYAAEDRIQEWKDQGCWDGEEIEDFDVRVKEGWQ